MLWYFSSKDFSVHAHWPVVSLPGICPKEIVKDVQSSTQEAKLATSSKAKIKDIGTMM